MHIEIVIKLNGSIQSDNRNDNFSVDMPLYVRYLDDWYRCIIDICLLMYRYMIFYTCIVCSPKWHRRVCGIITDLVTKVVATLFLISFIYKHSAVIIWCTRHWACVIWRHTDICIHRLCAFCTGYAVDTCLNHRRWRWKY